MLEMGLLARDESRAAGRLMPAFKDCARDTHQPERHEYNC